MRTQITLGISGNATDGYDQGLDSPLPFVGEVLNAYFPHPDWGVVVAGSRADNFYKDIRGKIPRDFYFEVTSTQSPVTIQWNRQSLPEKTLFSLYDHTSGSSVDMTQYTSYAFNSTTYPAGFTIKVSWGDISPPSSPTGLNIEGKDGSLLVKWSTNTEADLAGYKIYFGTKSSGYDRAIDLKNVNNYTLMGLTNETAYFIVLTAYDATGNESPYSTEANEKPGKPDVTPPVGEITINGNASSTGSTAVALALSASDERGVSQMCISNSDACSSWEAYGISRSWTLASGDGLKTVYAWFKDKAGNISRATSSTITLAAASSSGAGDTGSQGSTNTPSQQTVSTSSDQTSVTSANQSAATTSGGGYIYYQAGNDTGNNPMDTSHEMQTNKVRKKQISGENKNGISNEEDEPVNEKSIPIEFPAWKGKSNCRKLIDAEGGAIIYCGDTPPNEKLLARVGAHKGSKKAIPIHALRNIPEMVKRLINAFGFRLKEGDAFSYLKIQPGHIKNRDVFLLRRLVYLKQFDLKGI